MLSELTNKTSAVVHIIDDDAHDRIAECDDDDDLPWVIEEIRADRALTVHRDNIIAGYEAAGYTVFTNRFPTAGNFTWLHSLTDADDDADVRPAITAAEHTTCEGRALIVGVWGTGDGDTETEAVCTQPELHRQRWNTTTGHTGAVNDELTAEQVEAEQEQRRAARRELIANNKAWDASTTVRREFIGTLLSRKALPKGAAAFVAVTVTRHSYEVGNDHGSLAGTFLNLDGYNQRERLAALAENTPTKAGHVSLAGALSGGKHTPPASHGAPRTGPIPRTCCNWRRGVITSPRSRRSPPVALNLTRRTRRPTLQPRRLFAVGRVFTVSVARPRRPPLHGCWRRGHPTTCRFRLGQHRDTSNTDVLPLPHPPSGSRAGAVLRMLGPVPAGSAP